MFPNTSTTITTSLCGIRRFTSQAEARLMANDAGKMLIYEGSAAITFYLQDAANMPNGAQAVIKNNASAAVDITFNGPMASAGTKLAQKKACLLTVVDGVVHADGGVS